MLSSALIHGVLFVSVLLVFSRWLDDESVAEVCFYSLFAELLISLVSTNYFGVTDSQLFLDFGQISAGTVAFLLNLLLCFDLLSGVFLSILILALTMCFYFLVEYFEYDAGGSHIVILSALFSQVAFLFFCSFDLFLIIFFWEVISIISFFLVQHWTHRVSTFKAGLKVFNVSQVGDFPFLFFIFILYARVGTTSVPELLATLPLLAHEYIILGPLCTSLTTLLATLLSFAVLLKSAQFFFYPWLLDAMEAPVPISAQLHSSTLVVIGFYLYFRFQVLFLLAPLTSAFMFWCGVFTIIGASALGFFQLDGKRLLACSTASQLGYVVVALGLGLHEEGLFLLTFCCCNKAFTFVWFGVLMHHHNGLSDFRFIGGASNLNWFCHAGLAVAVANFTVLPGAFSWHAKSLFMQGLSPWIFSGAELGLEVLQLTWFFSSLYLFALYVTLFLKPNQGVNKPRKATSWQIVCRDDVFRAYKTDHTVSLMFFIVALIVFAALISPSMTGSLGFADYSWAATTMCTSISYY